MNHRKVYGGTPVGDGTLCESCTHAQIVQGHSRVERITICDYPFNPMQVPFRVLECTAYSDRRLLDFEEMEKIALDLTWVSVPKPAGFIRSSSRKPETERDEE